MTTTDPLLGFGTLSIESGATVSTPFLQVTGNAHGRVDLLGGTLSFGSINLFSGGIFNFSFGTLSISGKDGIQFTDTGLLRKQCHAQQREKSAAHGNVGIVRARLVNSEHQRRLALST